MRKWMLKALIQKGISFMPGKHRLNYLFQKYVTKGVRLSDEYFADRLVHLSRHEHYAAKYRGSLQHMVLLELGTGWYPVVPVGFFLAGAGPLYTIDISPLMDREKILATLRQYQKWKGEGRLQGLMIDPGRWAALEDLLRNADRLNFSGLLKGIQLQYLVGDARHLPLPEQSIEFICSNNTFEHIFPEVLADILREFHRVLTPRGVMSHFIDMSDHFAHLDPEITIYHFLRYSDRAWQRIDNDIQPQNRWRITHYRALYRSLGLPITEELHRPGDVNALRRISLHASFASIPEEELAISHSYLVSALASPAGAQPGSI